MSSSENFLLQQDSLANSSKAAEFMKKADIYDLIKLSMKSSSNKISAMDRYIQRAQER